MVTNLSRVFTVGNVTNTMLEMANFPKFLNSKFLEWQFKSNVRKTLDDYAEYLGISRPLLSQWMNGSKKPGPKNQKKLIDLYGSHAMEALGIDVDFYNLQSIWDLLTPEQRENLSRQGMEQAVKNEPKKARRKPGTHTP